MLGASISLWITSNPAVWSNLHLAVELNVVLAGAVDELRVRNAVLPRGRIHPHDPILPVLPLSRPPIPTF